MPLSAWRTLAKYLLRHCRTWNLNFSLLWKSGPGRVQLEKFWLLPSTFHNGRWGGCNAAIMFQVISFHSWHQYVQIKIWYKFCFFLKYFGQSCRKADQYDLNFTFYYCLNDFLITEILKVTRYPFFDFHYGQFPLIRVNGDSRVKLIQTRLSKRRTTRRWWTITGYRMFICLPVLWSWTVRLFVCIKCHLKDMWRQ